MPSKNYYRETVNKKTTLILEKTQDMLDMVRKIDERHLLRILNNQTPTGTNFGGWKGKCPMPTCKSHKRKHGKTDLPAYIVSGEKEGYVFHCLSCKTKTTTFKLLKAIQGDIAAEQYALERWDAGELCGGGWNCPLPQKVRERLLSEKEERREAYRHAEHELKALNYQKKYGSSTH